MSSGNVYERLFRLQATVSKLVLDGKRDPEKVAAVLQMIVNVAGYDTGPAEKFALLVDLDEITVPDDYNHATALAKFIKKNRQKFSVNDDITDANFPNPSRVLKPGQKLRVRAFKQVVNGATTSEERMTFLATQKAVHTGAQGASLAFEQKRDQLPKGEWYASFDEPERLWTDADGNCMVPYIRAELDGSFRWHLDFFKDFCAINDAFLCFTE